ncbi:FK506-binding protein-like [Brienomyrus brachyistius]|uniref:FK506-binding protein-like n=1 Tax=Brienomyrus brachyistius TaxID=42636 RepID=UPI0020B3EADB|nr:FK506-binding protein-like [Brienomyrus brachyistius]XP_048879782.1 FK506-binding protein-like [Brienomyrus brachyistius]XP_048879783.1 FK506-binding protein-like [Brienomyrus brachyistius]XP_048879784.1 FK506-binding protein-like [Brienomyrus brachyistius]XP_048879785.1 FK506-binding protein-like [Brienomyrus brachyistius]
MKTEGTDGTVSWVSVCPSGLLKVESRRTRKTGSADQSPVMGSVCRVRVWQKTEDGSGSQDTTGAEEHGILDELHSEVQKFSFPRSQYSVLQIPENTWVLVRMGDGQCDVVESCLEGMKAGEQCEVLVTALKDGTKPGSALTMQTDCSVLDPVGQEHQPLCYVLELHSFTSGRESWEMAPEEKWDWVKVHKKEGGERFRKADVWGAADCYSRALKLLLTLKDEEKGERQETQAKAEGGGLKAEESEASTGGQDASGEHDNKEMRASSVGDELDRKSDSFMSNEKTTSEKMHKSEVNLAIGDEYKAVRSELHSNLSLCQLRLGKPARARHSSSKAVELDPSNAKAWYRLGQACSQVGELGLAQGAFKKVLELQPSSPSAQKALREVKAREKDLDIKLGQKLSKMFS